MSSASVPPPLPPKQDRRLPIQNPISDPIHARTRALPSSFACDEATGQASYDFLRERRRVKGVDFTYRVGSMHEAGYSVHDALPETRAAIVGGGTQTSTKQQTSQKPQVQCAGNSKRKCAKTNCIVISVSPIKQRMCFSPFTEVAELHKNAGGRITFSVSLWRQLPRVTGDKYHAHSPESILAPVVQSHKTSQILQPELMHADLARLKVHKDKETKPKHANFRALLVFGGFKKMGPAGTSKARSRSKQLRLAQVNLFRERIGHGNTESKKWHLVPQSYKTYEEDAT